MFIASSHLYNVLKWQQKIDYINMVHDHFLLRCAAIMIFLYQSPNLSSEEKEYFSNAQSFYFWKKAVSLIIASNIEEIENAFDFTDSIITGL
ncbi:hypothetical protein M493_08830 [Geobacillus genomosp. 3]|uniref:Uncharacterized protein n=1 Tax=Geobacillus genomosp. 3 TaxID=1921421 RepID=S5ZCV5_GEOG3|nr:hypothetical protein M493_08830 [Geobacillus genomosp. 3]